MQPFAIDHRDFATVVAVSRARLSVSVGMAQLISFCAARLPHAVWGRLGNFDFEQGALALQSWLDHILRAESPPQEIDGFYFGLSEYHDGERDGGRICRLELAGGTGFDPEDKECLWAVDPTYTPRAAAIDSEGLKSIYRQLQIAGEQHATLGEYVLGLGYGCLAVRQMAERLSVQVLGDRPWRGLAVGFNCGDVVLLGRLELDGRIR